MIKLILILFRYKNVKEICNKVYSCILVKSLKFNMLYDKTKNPVNLTIFKTSRSTAPLDILLKLKFTGIGNFCFHI